MQIRDSDGHKETVEAAHRRAGGGDAADAMLRMGPRVNQGTTRFRLNGWMPIAVTAVLCLAALGNLLMSGLEISMSWGYEWYAARCSKDYRVWQQFEALLMPAQGGIPMVGPDGLPASGEGWALTRDEPIAVDVARCLPERWVDGKLRLPAGVNPLLVRDAIEAALDVSRGETDESLSGPAGYYPMDTPAGACVLLAARRLYDQAREQAPPASPKCGPLLWRHLGSWLLRGWLPFLVSLGLLLAARRNLRRSDLAG